MKSCVAGGRSAVSQGVHVQDSFYVNVLHQILNVNVFLDSELLEALEVTQREKKAY